MVWRLVLAIGCAAAVGGCASNSSSSDGSGSTDTGSAAEPTPTATNPVRKAASDEKLKACLSAHGARIAEGGEPVQAPAAFIGVATFPTGSRMFLWWTPNPEAAQAAVTDIIHSTNSDTSPVGATDHQRNIVFSLDANHTLISHGQAVIFDRCVRTS